MANEELDTKERILDAAEQLFSQRGVARTSVRALTSAAEVNLAAAHYHFGSKEALLRAVVLRRIAPLNEERLKRLDQIEAAGRLDESSVEPLLEALLWPTLEFWRKRELEPLWFVFSEPIETVRPLIGEIFSEINRRFGAAFQRALPHLGRDEVLERQHFAIGTMLHVVSGRFQASPDAAPLPPSCAEEILAKLIAFLAPGMRAPGLVHRAGRAS
jgi:AcrR family transcriptional regulator